MSLSYDAVASSSVPHPPPLTWFLLLVRQDTMTAIMIATNSTAPMTMPAIAPAAAGPQRLPSWGGDWHPEGGEPGSRGAKASGAAPREVSCRGGRGRRQQQD